MIKSNKIKFLSFTLTLYLLFSMIIPTVIATAEDNSSQIIDVTEVYPGGMPFGIKLYTDGPVIVGFSDVECDTGSKTPAIDAGLKIGDIIIKVNGEKLKDAEQFIRTIENEPSEIALTYMRNNSEYTVKFKPSLSKTDGKYKTGMWLRDSTAGIGTVTFIIPENGEFAGLGHGICDTETGELIPLMRGIVTGVKITGVNRGQAGAPGELKGFFTEQNNGVILKNTASGVFGILKDTPNAAKVDGTVELGSRENVHLGEAYIISTVDDGLPTKYNIEITNVGEAEKSHSFEIKITDDTLIDKTGGIVQGMSGSPILQDGKLIGAVTHVLVRH